MKITADEAAHVAHLARLSFSADELQLYTGHLNAILEYVAQLQQVDTEGVDPLFHPLAISNVFRGDEPVASLPNEAALSNAPQKEEGAFLVPKII
ncbi:MAG: Asp-tRNA(Asn)/Glu-tRNA(Gln) amidotransferase subunit GatC [Dissulfuribacterales bacterium]